MLCEFHLKKKEKSIRKGGRKDKRKEILQKKKMLRNENSKPLKLQLQVRKIWAGNTGQSDFDVNEHVIRSGNREEKAAKSKYIMNKNFHRKTCSTKASPVYNGHRCF